jgi:NADPH:quinone reductase-like Zn-dependent oxidoreductase
MTRADENPKMRAVVAHEYGAPDVLKLEQVQRPEPNDDEALVRVLASSVNPADPLTLSGKYAKEFGTHLPLIPGYDIAGVVEKTGANVTKLKVGDAVYGYPTFGGGWRITSQSRSGKSLRNQSPSTLWTPRLFRWAL